MIKTIKSNHVEHVEVPENILIAFGFRKVKKSDITRGSNLSMGDWIMEGENLFYSPKYHSQKTWAENLINYLSCHSFPKVLKERVS